MEFRIEGNHSREYSTVEKVDIEVLKAMQEIKTRLDI